MQQQQINIPSIFIRFFFQDNLPYSQITLGNLLKYQIPQSKNFHQQIKNLKTESIQNCLNFQMTNFKYYQEIAEIIMGSQQKQQVLIVIINSSSNIQLNSFTSLYSHNKKIQQIYIVKCENNLLFRKLEISKIDTINDLVLLQEFEWSDEMDSYDIFLQIFSEIIQKYKTNKGIFPKSAEEFQKISNQSVQKPFSMQLVEQIFIEEITTPIKKHISQTNFQISPGQSDAKFEEINWKEDEIAEINMMVCNDTESYDQLLNNQKCQKLSQNKQVLQLKQKNSQESDNNSRDIQKKWSRKVSKNKSQIKSDISQNLLQFSDEQILQNQNKETSNNLNKVDSDTLKNSDEQQTKSNVYLNPLQIIQKNPTITQNQPNSYNYQNVVNKKNQNETGINEVQKINETQVIESSKIERISFEVDNSQCPTLKSDLKQKQDNEQSSYYCQCIIC